MADLNRLKQNVLKESSELNDQLKRLYANYEQLYQESFKELSSSRMASGGSMEGLETFYIAVQTVRRNRDVVTSLMKGLKSLRPMDKFQFIEEDIEPDLKKTQKVKAKPTMDISELKIEEPETEETING